MSEKEIFEKLKVMIVEQLGVSEDKIKLESTFTDDLAADSLDLVELIMNIEEGFEIHIPDEAAEELSCVEDLVKYIASNK